MRSDPCRNVSRCASASPSRASLPCVCNRTCTYPKVTTVLCSGKGPWKGTGPRPRPWQEVAAGYAVGIADGLCRHREQCAHERCAALTSAASAATSLGLQRQPRPPNALLAGGRRDAWHAVGCSVVSALAANRRWCCQPFHLQTRRAAGRCRRWCTAVLSSVSHKPRRWNGLGSSAYAEAPARSEELTGVRGDAQCAFTAGFRPSCSFCPLSC